MLHRIRRQTRPRQPLRCPHVQPRQPFGVLPRQQAAQQIGKQRVIAKPDPVGVQRDQEQVGRLDLPDAFGGIARPRNRIRQGCGKPLEDRRAQKEIQKFGRLPTEHLLHKEIRDIACRARKAVQKPRLVVSIAQRQRCQMQPGDPAFGAMVQRQDLGLRQGQRLATVHVAFGLLQREPQLRLVQPYQLVPGAQAGQLKSDLTARAKHKVEPCGRIGQKPLDEPGDLGRGQMVKVVDHQKQVGVRAVQRVDQRQQDGVDRQRRA